MNKFTVALGAGLLLSLGAGPQVALAAQDGAHYDGGCGYASTSDPTGLVAGSGTQTGVIYTAVSAYQDQVPAAVGVVCELLVNGNRVAAVTTASTGIALSVDSVSYEAAETDVVTMCEIVTINGGRPMTDCYGSEGAGGRCAGTAEVGCDYCSYNGSASGSDWDECEPPDDANYHWEGCTIWVANTCHLGA